MCIINAVTRIEIQAPNRFTRLSRRGCQGKSSPVTNQPVSKCGPVSQMAQHEIPSKIAKEIIEDRQRAKKQQAGYADPTDSLGNFFTIIHACPYSIAKHGDNNRINQKTETIQAQSRIICLQPVQSRKLVNCNGMPSDSCSVRNIAITSCKSSRFLPVTLTCSP